MVKNPLFINKIAFHSYFYARVQRLLVGCGPPDSMREHIVAACLSMKTGDWNACVKFLINDKMNNKVSSSTEDNSCLFIYIQVWNLISQIGEVHIMLINKIKEGSLRIYLLNNAAIFSTISIPSLADMFELPIKQVYGIVCKMIDNQELVISEGE
jgi:translation initiation factor 3 subunit C